MNNFFKKLPIPIAGLALALAGLGNVLASYGQPLRYFLGSISALLILLLTIKIISQWKCFTEEMKNPLSASVFCTYPMAWMILCTYLKPMMGEGTKFIWYAAILLHICLILYFTTKFVLHFNIKQVFPSWFIVYVGIAAAAMTCKPFGGEAIGKLSFWFGLIGLIILLIVISKRVFVVKELPIPAAPTLMIYAAPTSLCLAGYMNAFDEKNSWMIIGLLIIGQMIYLAAMVKLTKLIKLPFFPSFSSFTFPLVISATALKLSTGFLIKAGYEIGFLKYLVMLEEGIAFVIVLYVFIRYLKFLFEKPKVL